VIPSEIEFQAKKVVSEETVPDLQPFAIEPIILGRLHRLNVPPSVLGFAVAIIAFFAFSWSALASNLFYRTSVTTSWWADFWIFALRNSTKEPNRTVPYLADYPSIILNVTVTIAIYLVYDLFRGASVLHSDMDNAGCIRYTQAGKEKLTEAVNAMNAKFSRWGRFSGLALILSFGATAVLNLRLRGRLLTFLDQGDLYPQWWASLNPLRPGAILWILFGGIGIYMVYVEAILGLMYAKFLKGCRDDYQFRANMLNPDGVFGWSRLRQIVSNLEVGVICTLLSSWALSFYLQPAVDSVIAVSVLAVFIGIVAFVFINVTRNFRRQVKESKNAQRAEITQDIARNTGAPEVERLLRVLVAYRELDLVSKIPSSPIRRGWIVAGAISILIPIVGISLQILRFLNPT
jgi:hypothetical protein